MRYFQGLEVLKVDIDIRIICKFLQTNMIIIIDYKTGNYGSVLNMLKKIGAEAVISSNILDIKKADKLILSGIGSFDNGMKNLQELGILSILDEKVLESKTPILGICLGMQLFAKKSEEGDLAGLGWIDAKVIKFKFNKNHNNLKVPHMGWNTAELSKRNVLFEDMDEEQRFYFTHSYYMKCNENNDVIATTEHGIKFTSIVQKNNIFGVQFHPEKSHRFGMQLLNNFVKI